MLRSVCFSLLLLLTVLVPSLVRAAPLSVESFRVGVHPDKTRLVIELSNEADFRTFLLPDPYRLVVDMPIFDWDVGRVSPPPGGLIKAVRTGALQPGISRIVVDLSGPAVLETAFAIKAEGQARDRLVIDLKSASRQVFTANVQKVLGDLKADEGAPAAAIPLPVKTAGHLALPPSSEEEAIPPSVQSYLKAPYKPPAPADAATGGYLKPPSKPKSFASGNPSGTLAAPSEAETSPVAVSTQTRAAIPLKAPSGKKPLIIIDPGHGGGDPGAIGANNMQEKMVTLATAKELKKQLEATGRYRVVLTRSKDVFIKLYDRVQFARDQGGDLFISLHADSVNRPGVRGASIYTLSDKASDAQTAKLAARENMADLIAGVDLRNEDKDVANILIDLARRDTMNQSKFFANTVVDYAGGQGIRLLERPHRFAGFAVLKAPDIPSVLIEMGYMSNKQEVSQLSTPAYREKIATAVVAGVNAYFSKVQQNGHN